MNTVQILQEKLESQLQDLESQEMPLLPKTLQAVQACYAVITELNKYVSGYAFTNDNTEIHYFKVSLPSIYQHFIYHTEVFRLHSQLPPIGQQQEDYWQDVLNNIGAYFLEQRELLQYQRTLATHLDAVYFKRHSPHTLPPLEEISLTLDANSTTIASYHVSRLLALERLAAYVEQVICDPPVAGSSNENANALQWTGSKVSLIELIYGLQLAGVFNNSSIDIKSLVRHFEALFQVKLGNVYNAFQEMRLRKKNRSPFLDQLKERITQKMDELDEG